MERLGWSKQKWLLIERIFPCAFFVWDLQLGTIEINVFFPNAEF